MEYETYIVTTDLSEASSKALSEASMLSQQYDKPLIVVSVFPEFHIPALLARQMRDTVSQLELEKEYRESCQKDLADFCETKALSPRAKLHPMFSSDSPASVVANYASSQENPLIVLGSHGRGALSNLLVGSTLAELIRHSPCPLLVVPFHEEVQ